MDVIKSKRKIFFVLLILVLVFTLAGCGAGENEEGDPEAENSQDNEQNGTAENDTPDFHYTGELYKWDSTYNDYQGGYLLVEDGPWEDFPADFPIVGGYMDLSLGGGGPGEYSDSHSILIFTSGGDDGEIANWFRQEAEAAGWEVTDFEISEQYGSTRFRVSNDDWYGDFVVQSKDAALEGYDGSMERSESDFDEAAFSGQLFPQN